MDMPMSTKALYFLLGLEADDYGFVSPKRIIRVHGGSDDDVKLLIAKGFVIPFADGVVVITDWNKHNWLDRRRVKPTEYKKELAELAIVDNQYCLASAEQPLSNGLATAKQMLRENSIEECSIEEYSKDICAEQAANAATPRKNSDDVAKTKPEQGAEPAVITLLLNDKTEHPVTQSQVDKWVDLYPAVDIMQELRNMVGWIDANPSQRKTKTGILRFVNRWLAKAQDQGGRGYNPRENGTRGGKYGNPGRNTGTAENTKNKSITGTVM